jgi:hypothetical protein
MLWFQATGSDYAYHNIPVLRIEVLNLDPGAN